MDEFPEPIYLANGVFSIEVYISEGAVRLNDAENYRSTRLNYREFGALIKELEQIRRSLVAVDPWADPDMMATGLD